MVARKKKIDCYLQLTGKVYFIEKRGIRTISKEEIDGKLVLKCLLEDIKEGLRLLEMRDRIPKP